MRTQETCEADWTLRIDRLLERTRTIAETTPRERLDRPPAGGGWSPSQVFEHLVVAEESYLAIMRGVVGRRGPLAAAGTGWKPSFTGGLLAWSIRSVRRLPAPPQYLPPAPRPDVLEAFGAGLEETRDLLKRARRLAWRRIVFPSPITGLIRPNLGDAFEIIVAHGERHLRQIERRLTAQRPPP